MKFRCGPRINQRRRGFNRAPNNNLPGSPTMHRVSLAVLVSASMLAAAPASAQAPQTEKNVSMAMAIAIIQGTLDQCTKDGYKVSVVIVDKAGNIAASVKGDGTNPHTMEFARLKAYTARTRGQ